MRDDMIVKCDRINKRVTIVKFDEVKKVIFDRLDDLTKKWKDSATKYDPMLDKISAQVKVLQENLADIDRRLVHTSISNLTNV